MLAFGLALSWLACSHATDVYVGSDLDPAPPPPAVAGAVATPPQAVPAGGASAGETNSGGAGGADDVVSVAGSSAPPPPDPPDVQPATCAVGSADCDASPANGCETDTTNDPAHCGSCQLACVAPDCACVGGERVVACPAGMGDCDGLADNGCETDLANDEQNCGTCAFVCVTGGAGVAGASCQDGACVLTCQLPTRRGDCDGDPANGCETDLYHDADHCGSCGMQCAACIDTRCL
jgi:hypothetical protein